MNKKLNFFLVIFLFVSLFFSYTVIADNLQEKVIINGNYTTITLNQEIGKDIGWEYEIEDKNIVEIAKKSYINKMKTTDDNSLKDISTWYIKGISTGKTIIKFNLMDKKTDQILNTIKYCIRVKPNKIQVIKGNLIEISLTENHSTGFTWHVNKKDNNIVKIHHDIFIKPETEPGFVGKSGIHYWYIQGLNKGETELIFDLYQDWNKESIKRTKKYIIEVK